MKSSILLFRTQQFLQEHAVYEMIVRRGPQKYPKSLLLLKSLMPVEQFTVSVDNRKYAIQGLHFGRKNAHLGHHREGPWVLSLGLQMR